MVEQVKKYFNENGDVGVLVSGGYGAGWSTWDSSENTEQILFEPTVIQMILDDADPKAVMPTQNTVYFDIATTVLIYIPHETYT